MKNRFFKLVVASVTTLTLLLTFTNVDASSIDDYAHFYSPSEYFNGYPYVEKLEDLKGTIWHFNVDLEYIAEQLGDSTISLSFLQNQDTNSIYDLPYFLQLRSEWIRTDIEGGYPLFNDSNVNLNIAPLCNSSEGSAITINTNQSGGKVYLNYYPYTLSYTSSGSQITNLVNEVINDTYSIQSCCLSNSVNYYINTYLDIAFTSHQNINDNYVGSNELYLFFPNTDYEILDFSTSDIFEFSFLGILLKYSTRVIFPYEFYEEIDNSYSDGYTEGNEKGYENGYSDGYDDGTLTTDNGYRFTFLTGIFNSVSDLLSIEVFPNVQLGYFVFIPLALGITGMIFWFWRKD